MKSLVKKVKVGLKDFPSPLPVMTCAASLAHLRLLGSVREMRLRDVNLTSVSAEHLVSLSSSVTECVDIQSVCGCDLDTILDNVKITTLEIGYQSLDSKETQALVRAMESGVERVWLKSETRLNMEGLIEYNGQGKCKEVKCWYDTRDKYRKQLKTWAMSRDWKVTVDDKFFFIIERI